MALTKAQWKAKLKSLVQSWVFERDKMADAIFSGIAAVFERAQLDAEENRDQTFFDNAGTDYLDWHGDERGKERYDQEVNSTYSLRIKKISNNSDIESLKEIVDSFLVVGESEFKEDYDPDNFLNREAFANRNVVGYDIDYNAFTIFVEKQIREPESFANREYFLDREAFAGSIGSSLSLLQRIVRAVNENKALGTVYRLIEKVG